MLGVCAGTRQLTYQSLPSFLLGRSGDSTYRRARSLKSIASRSLQVAAAPAAMAVRPDYSSFANSQEVLVRHSHFELDVNFSTKVIEGFAHIHIEAVSEAPKELVLDTRDLTMHGVTLQTTKEKLKYKLEEKHKALGSPLHIELPAGFSSGSKLDLGIRFSCSPESTALQFLDPEQTAGGKHPYLFTQCQAIHARSLVPCQDTPAVKSSYSAAVRVPAGLTALMSAVPSDGPPVIKPNTALAFDDSSTETDALTAPEGVPHLPAAPSGTDTKIFYYLQKVPIPSYLIALAVGELESRKLGDRSCVWSEPSVVEAAAYEFADTAKYLEAGEAIAGPYVWGRYDLLLLPPSFPYGGMENPCLTFVTPTLLAGDRSLTNVIAHEIAHSWTGNLVTNASWEHFWLNEGWTMFLERKITGRLQGESALQFSASQGYMSLTSEVASIGPHHNFTRLVPDLSSKEDPDDAFSDIPYEKGFYFIYYLQGDTALQFYAAQGATSLADEVSRIGPDHNFTRLLPDLSAGEDPDDAFSRVPYEKGFYFLYYLQSVVGGPSAFEPFMRAYLDAFAFKTVTSEQFKDFFMDYFKDNKAVSSIDWETWYHAPGMPPVKNDYDTSMATAAYDLAVKWHTADVMGIGAEPPNGVSPDDIKGWGSDQIVAFLDKLNELRSMTPMAASMCREMNKLYKLDEAKNCEIRCSWYKLCIGAGDQAVTPGVVDMLSTQGRMKYLRPLYRALFKSKTDKQLALDTFKKVSKKYHPIAQKMVAVDLQLSKQIE